jgi:hypothetical protein
MTMNRRATFHCGQDTVDAAGGKQIGCLLTKLAVTIQNRVPVRTRFRECLPELLRYPGAARVFRDIEMENLASAVFDNEKAVQDAKSQSRHGEEVQGRDDVSVIAEEADQSLRASSEGDRRRR